MRRCICQSASRRTHLVVDGAHGHHQIGAVWLPIRRFSGSTPTTSGRSRHGIRSGPSLTARWNAKRWRMSIRHAEASAGWIDPTAGAEQVVLRPAGEFENRGETQAIRKSAPMRMTTSSRSRRSIDRQPRESVSPLLFEAAQSIRHPATRPTTYGRLRRPSAQAESYGRWGRPHRQAQVHADAFTDTALCWRGHGRSRVDTSSEKGRPTRSSGTQPSTEVTDSGDPT